MIKIKKDKKKELKLITYDISPDHNEPVHISISKEKNIINRIEKLNKYILKHKDSLYEREINEHITNEIETIMKSKNKNTGAGIIDLVSFTFRMYFWHLKQLNEKNPLVVTYKNFITCYPCKPLNIMNQKKGK